MGWSLMLWPVLCLISPVWGWILSVNRFAYQNDKQTRLFSQSETLKALPSLLEYNSSAGELSFMPFPGRVVISI